MVQHLGFIVYSLLFVVKTSGVGVHRASDACTIALAPRAVAMRAAPTGIGGWGSESVCFWLAWGGYVVPIGCLVYSKSGIRRVYAVEFRSEGVGSRVWVPECRGKGRGFLVLGVRVYGAGIRVSGVGFRV